ncbi:MAG: methylated-DNA--[protein]-cysteine S-methyltransferase [Proteobacteria bacterium]|nr:methylated-DNA--[protein]-cysteine S-methyltransferase [Pseudomonadota bacterium]
MKKSRGIQLLPPDVTYDRMASPVGELTIITSPQGLHAILWGGDFKNPQYEKFLNCLNPSVNEPTILATKNQLSEYFQGERKKFDLPLVIQGTDFQIRVWNELLKIPYAQTISYGEQAEKISDKNKARAVGMANGRNPIPIIIPCHRVIGSKGHLTGFGGGLSNKAYLLKLENSA